MPPNEPGEPNRAIARINARLDAGSKRMDAMQAELTANTVVTTEVRELLENARAGLRVLGWLGNGLLAMAKGATAVGTVVGLLYSAWYFVKTGGAMPPKH